MKKTIIFIAAAAAVLSGCSKILDGISPKNAISTGAVSEADLNKLTNGVLYTMESYVSNFWFSGDVMGEALGNGPGISLSPDPLLMTPSSNDVASRWQNSFTALRQVNELLSTATGTSATAGNARKTAYFCRALIYFNLVTRWENVPIVRSSTNDEIALSPKNEVYDFIIGDLKSAGENASTKSGFFYVSDAAVNALYAKTYLWMGENVLAAQYAGKVIDESGCALEDTSEGLAATWVNGTSSREIIFALANLRTSGQITLYSYVNDTDASWNYSVGGEWCTKEGETIRSISLWDDVPGVKRGDIRRSVNITDSDLKRILKFPNGNESLNQFVKNPDATQSPLVLFRIAEMYLVKAEAEGNTAAGHATLESFMKKRYASVSLPASMTDRQWQDLLLDENMREFMGEGHRWFDVKRMGRLDKFRTLDGRDWLMLWPIPQREIDLLSDKSKYPQNPGYAKTNE